MPVNYVSDSNGNTIAVQIPIEEWNRIKNKYPDADDFEDAVPEWQQELVTSRLQMIADHPDRLTPVDNLFDELDKQE